MFIYTTKTSLERHLKAFRDQNKTIGLVPTMGAIHDGHLSLLEKSLLDNDCTVVSIFVNPTQFNNAEDLEKYPRNLERDVKTIESLSDQIVIFAPSVTEIYQNNTVSESFSYDGLEFEMEGAQRPGHFDGVGTVVKKLFEIIRPNQAYFGEKDFQQLQIVKKMVEKTGLNVKVVGVSIHRELSGLAMSSRNERLSAQGLEQATYLYQVLLEAKKRFDSENPVKVQQFVESEFKNNPNFDLEYFTIADEATLKSVTEKEAGHKYRGFLVAHLEGVRLIDNISLN
ncbi:pantoate--beta-alanine ligase [Flavobacterium sp. HSC-61S13]|uniref:pantoate--beta-alanine ligase n=1 Tax=Flavobacterium sp. HSC-61S13 TaxID=2910963 RepID=UPI00209EC5F0|nr:pantoate--beta-alanine ligase [Flavobacterium sp. HSC-61S13]MCP1997144.1 pantoate--beta-alanine ligase [Flavobacterium sp. HSC-61S13]